MLFPASKELKYWLPDQGQLFSSCKESVHAVTAEKLQYLINTAFFNFLHHTPGNGDIFPDIFAVHIYRFVPLVGKAHVETFQHQLKGLHGKIV